MATSPFIITFAGMVGTSKTPIAHHLSLHLNIPIFSTDAIRTETVEDIGSLDQLEYTKRRSQRLAVLLEHKESFIFDASVDREWSSYNPQLTTNGYRVFLISLDWSQEKTVQLYKDKSYIESQGRFDQLWQDHQQFLTHFPNVISLHLTDIDFLDRLAICLAACQQWIHTEDTFHA